MRQADDVTAAVGDVTAALDKLGWQADLAPEDLKKQSDYILQLRKEKFQPDKSYRYHGTESFDELLGLARGAEAALEELKAAPSDIDLQLKFHRQLDLLLTRHRRPLPSGDEAEEYRRIVKVMESGYKDPVISAIRIKMEILYEYPNPKTIYGEDIIKFYAADDYANHLEHSRIPSAFGYYRRVKTSDKAILWHDYNKFTDKEIKNRAKLIDKITRDQAKSGGVEDTDW